MAETRTGRTTKSTPLDERPGAMSHSEDTVSILLPRPVLVLLGTAAATVTIAGMHTISGIVGPAFLALVLTIAAHPLRGWLRRLHLPGWAATLLMTFCVYAFLLGFALA